MIAKIIIKVVTLNLKLISEKLIKTSECFFFKHDLNYAFIKKKEEKKYENH